MLNRITRRPLDRTNWIPSFGRYTLTTHTSSPSLGKSVTKMQSCSAKPDLEWTIRHFHDSIQSFSRVGQRSGNTLSGGASKCCVPNLWRLLDQHFETFQQVYDERFAGQVRLLAAGHHQGLSSTEFLKCGDLHQGFARVRCADCQHEMSSPSPASDVASVRPAPRNALFSFGLHVAEDICRPVPHRQFVWTIPKRLRLHTRFDRKLLGKLCSCAWTCIQAEVRRLLGRQDVLPGMVAAIQTHGELLHWHPHFHVLLTCGAFTPRVSFWNCRGTRTRRVSFWNCPGDAKRGRKSN